MPRIQTSTALLAGYQRRLKESTWTASNVQDAYAAGKLVRRDVDKVYRGLFLQSVVRLERTIEELLLGLMTSKLVHPRPVRPQQVYTSYNVASLVLTRGRYVDLLPIDKLEKVSEIFLHPAGNPIAGCPSAIKQEMVKVLAIRNYIAHESSFSEKKWRDNVVSPTVLPAGGRDLLSYFQHTHAGAVSKYEYHIGEMLRCARYFCT